METTTKTANTKATKETARLYQGKKYGDLHVTVKDGTVWFCLQDICRSLALTIKEGRSIITNAKSRVSQNFVKYRVQTISREFVDGDGLLTLVTESRKNNADEYRKWATIIGANAKSVYSRQQKKAAGDVHRETPKKAAPKQKKVPAIMKSKDVVVEITPYTKERIVYTKDDVAPYPTLEELFTILPPEIFVSVLDTICMDYQKNHSSASTGAKVAKFNLSIMEVVRQSVANKYSNLVPMQARQNKNYRNDVSDHNLFCCK